MWTTEASVPQQPKRCYEAPRTSRFDPTRLRHLAPPCADLLCPGMQGIRPSIAAHARDPKHHFSEVQPRMKTFLSICALASATSMFAHSAHAQDIPNERPVSWGVMAGGENVTGAYRGSFQSGFLAGGFAQFPLPSEHFALRADVMIHMIGENDALCNERACSSENNYSILGSGALGIVARLNDARARWSPYALAGATVYVTDDAFETFRANHLGLQGGFGLEFRPAKHTFFVEVRYMSIAPGGVVPFVIGMRF